MAAFRWINLDWFAIGVPATCIGSVGVRLALKGFGPLAALLAGLAIVCFVALRERELEHGERDPAGAQGHTPQAGPRKQALVWRSVRGALPYVLPCLFAFVPSVSASIFSIFSCEGCARAAPAAQPHRPCPQPQRRRAGWHAPPYDL